MSAGVSAFNLVKVYRGGVRALDGVSFETPEKGIVVLVGPNGAGKTTLVRILSTVLRPTSGSAYVKGFDVVRDVWRVRGIISVVPQEGEPDGYLTVWEHVYLYLRSRGIDGESAERLAREALEALGMWDLRRRLCAKLSGGQRRRVLIAMALAVPAEVYFLDEPTVGLDPVARRETWEVLRRYAKDRLIFLTTHYMEEAEELGERVIMINRGRIVAEGEPRSLVERLGYGYRVSVEPCGGELLKRLTGEWFAVVKEEGRCTVYAKTSSDLSHLLSALTESGASFTVRRVSLEDVFVSLVRGGGRG